MEYPLTAVILTRNEEHIIGRCLATLTFCEEIVVIDDGSTDKTRELAKEKGAKVLKREMQGNFAEQRNYALRQASHDWVFFIDADEEVSKELQNSIVSLFHGYIDDRKIEKQFNNLTMEQCYCLKRRDFWWGTELKHGETQKVRNQGIIRLVKKDSGRWLGNVHEVFHTAKKVGTLDGYLNHYPHPEIKDFLHDINVYSTLRAKELYGLGKSVNVISLIVYPFSKFVLNYFVYLGFLDGPAGFAYAFLMSFHSFLVRAKLYQYRIEKSIRQLADKN